MTEETIVRENLMTQEGYTPYCGNNAGRKIAGGCSNPRTKWNGGQFRCTECGWTSQFPFDFIKKYKVRWAITNNKK